MHAMRESECENKFYSELHSKKFKTNTHYFLILTRKGELSKVLIFPIFGFGVYMFDPVHITFIDHLRSI